MDGEVIKELTTSLAQKLTQFPRSECKPPCCISNPVSHPLSASLCFSLSFQVPPPPQNHCEVLFQMHSAILTLIPAYTLRGWSPSEEGGTEANGIQIISNPKSSLFLPCHLFNASGHGNNCKWSRRSCSVALRALLGVHSESIFTWLVSPFLLLASVPQSPSKQPCGNLLPVVQHTALPSSSLPRGTAICCHRTYTFWQKQFGAQTVQYLFSLYFFKIHPNVASCFW